MPPMMDDAFHQPIILRKLILKILIALFSYSVISRWFNPEFSKLKAVSGPQTASEEDR